jgi:hypothetical protein
VLLNRDYFFSSFNESTDLESAYQTGNNVINMAISNSEKEKLRGELTEIYSYFKHINQSAVS